MIDDILARPTDDAAADEQVERAAALDDTPPMTSTPEPEPAARPDEAPEDEVPEAAAPDAEALIETEATASVDVEPIAPDEAGPGSPSQDVPDEAPPAPVGRITVGRLIAEQLHAGGVRWAFTVPGESFLGLLEALPAAGIRVVATRHEGGASFMADAVGQLTGRPALCLGTRAVGAANLAIGIHTARSDSAPVIAIAGQVARRDRGREAFQEIDLVATIGGLAKSAAEPMTADEVPGAVAAALRDALTGRQGPTFLSLAEDLLDETVDGDVPRQPAGSSPASRPDPSVLGAVLHLLAGAERPVILAGAGVLRARCSTDLMRLAELLRVPVIASWRRGDVVPNDHPLYLGMAGLAAPATVRERLESADAILAIGTRLNEATTYGYAIPHPGQRWALVDVEPRPAVAGLPAPDLALASDARSFVKAALDRLAGGCLDAASADARSAANIADRAAWEAATVVGDAAWDGPSDPARVVATLRRVLPDDAIVTTDAGNFAGWLARGFRFKRPGTFLGPTSGAMGYGLPAAIAAALVHRDRRVVAWTGDGGLAMTMAELETAVREKLKLVVLVFDNERYGTIAMHQARREDGAGLGTDLGPIDFAAIARGFGANGTRVDRDADVEVALRSALVADRPTVIQLALDRRWVSVDEHP